MRDSSMFDNGMRLKVFGSDYGAQGLSAPRHERALAKLYKMKFRNSPAGIDHQTTGAT